MFLYLRSLLDHSVVSRCLTSLQLTSHATHQAGWITSRLGIPCFKKQVHRLWAWMRHCAAMSTDYKRFLTQTQSLYFCCHWPASGCRPVPVCGPHVEWHWPRHSHKLRSTSLNENLWAIRKWDARGSFGKLEWSPKQCAEGCGLCPFRAPALGQVWTFHWPPALNLKRRQLWTDTVGDPWKQ